jgi:cholesterol oxidase
MTSFDYDMLIIGSGFGGSVAALRAAEKGYLVADGSIRIRALRG